MCACSIYLLGLGEVASEELVEVDIEANGVDDVHLSLALSLSCRLPVLTWRRVQHLHGAERDDELVVTELLHVITAAFHLPQQQNGGQLRVLCKKDSSYCRTSLVISILFRTDDIERSHIEDNHATLLTVQYLTHFKTNKNKKCCTDS